MGYIRWPIVDGRFRGAAQGANSEALSKRELGDDYILDEPNPGCISPRSQVRDSAKAG